MKRACGHWPGQRLHAAAVSSGARGQATPRTKTYRRGPGRARSAGFCFERAFAPLTPDRRTPLPPYRERSAVETALTPRGHSFQRMCCLLNENRNTLEDIVRIGSEPRPWYCTENDMYLVFEFDSMPDAQSPRHPDDRLRRIALSPWLGGCL
jgi:hypothetical protein